MKELTKVFKDVEIHIDVIDDKNVMFDISGIAHKYGKTISEWSKSKRISEKIKNLEKSGFLNKNKAIVKIANTTKIHNRLFVDFARWINPTFDIYADEIIYDILSGNKKVIETEKTELIKEIKIKEVYFKNQLSEKDKEIEKAKRKSYAYERDGNYQCLTRIIKDTNADISVSTLKKILLKEKMVLEKEVTVTVPVANKYESIEENGQILFNKDSVMKIFSKYAIQSTQDNQLFMEFLD